MSLINITDNEFVPRLEKNNINWQFNIPQELNPESVYLNPERINRLARVGGGLGSLIIANADIETNSTIQTKVNPDGTISATGIKHSSRYSRGYIDEDKKSSFHNYKFDDVISKASFANTMEKTLSVFYRPIGRVDIDSKQIREKLKIKDISDNPWQWSKEIDKSIKAGITDLSIHTHFLKTTFLPEYRKVPFVGNLLFASNVYLKTYLAYKGIEELGHSLESSDDFIIWSINVAIKNMIYGTSSGMILKLLGKEVSLKQYKPSILDPHIPIDRALFAGMQQLISSPVIKYSE